MDKKNGERILEAQEEGRNVFIHIANKYPYSITGNPTRVLKNINFSQKSVTSFILVVFSEWAAALVDRQHLIIPLQ